MNIGSSRKTYLVGKFAIKVPSLHLTKNHFLRGMQSNMCEANMAHLVSEAKVTKVYFCGWFGLFQIAERVELCTDLDQFYSDLNDLCSAEPGRRDFYSHDAHMGNFGYNDEGDLIKLDYAMPFMDDL